MQCTVNNRWEKTDLWVFSSQVVVEVQVLHSGKEQSSENKRPRSGLEPVQPCTQGKAGVEAEQAAWEAASHMPVLFGFGKVPSTHGNSAS